MSWQYLYVESGREIIFFIDLSHQPMQMTRMMMMGRALAFH
jgi:hypothetical protein